MKSYEKHTIVENNKEKEIGWDADKLFPNRKARNTLDKLMRIFNVCKRYSYQRLLEGRERKKLKKELQPIFQLNSRFLDDAIMQAQRILDAMQELCRNLKK